MMALAASTLLSGFTRTAGTVLRLYSTARASATFVAGVAFALFSRGPRQDIYNILWAVVFGFATLNILSLATRRMEPGTRRRLSFGELMAVMTVVMSVLLLGFEMLSLFHIFPIKLKR